MSGQPLNDSKAPAWADYRGVKGNAVSAPANANPRSCGNPSAFKINRDHLAAGTPRSRQPEGYLKSSSKAAWRDTARRQRGTSNNSVSC